MSGYPLPLPNVKYPPSHLLLVVAEGGGKTEPRSDPDLPLLPWNQGLMSLIGISPLAGSLMGWNILEKKNRVHFQVPAYGNSLSL